MNISKEWYRSTNVSPIYMHRKYLLTSNNNVQWTQVCHLQIILSKYQSLEQMNGNIECINYQQEDSCEFYAHLSLSSHWDVIRWWISLYRINTAIFRKRVCLHWFVWPFWEIFCLRKSKFIGIVVWIQTICEKIINTLKAKL